MSLNMLYLAATTLALLGWVLLLYSAITHTTMRWMNTRTMPVILAVAYSVMMLGLLPLQGGGFTSLDGLVQLYTQPKIVLAGWIHYLAIDLFIGGWQLQTTRREKIPVVILVLSLLLTMLFGPLGLLFFLVGRQVVGQRNTPAPA